jgi:hypothetical protein
VDDPVDSSMTRVAMPSRLPADTVPSGANQRRRSVPLAKFMEARASALELGGSHW